MTDTAITTTAEPAVAPDPDPAPPAFEPEPAPVAPAPAARSPARKPAGRTFAPITIPTPAPMPASVLTAIPGVPTVTATSPPPEVKLPPIPGLTDGPARQPNATDPWSDMGAFDVHPRDRLPPTPEEIEAKRALDEKTTRALAETARAPNSYATRCAVGDQTTATPPVATSNGFANRAAIPSEGAAPVDGGPWTVAGFTVDALCYESYPCQHRVVRTGFDGVGALTNGTEIAKMFEDAGVAIPPHFAEYENGRLDYVDSAPAPAAIDEPVAPAPAPAAIDEPVAPAPANATERVQMTEVAIVDFDERVAAVYVPPGLGAAELAFVQCDGVRYAAPKDPPPGMENVVAFRDPIDLAAIGFLGVGVRREGAGSVAVRLICTDGRTRQARVVPGTAARDWRDGAWRPVAAEDCLVSARIHFARGH